MSSESSTNNTSLELPWSPPNGVYGNYDLHCHCGAVRFRMKLSPPLYTSETTNEHPERSISVNCHCSYCSRIGYWALYPFAKDIEWVKGLEHRREYRAGAKKNPFWACGQCHCVLGANLRNLMLSSVCQTGKRDVLSM
ncbi:hypothetical protein BAUCODRAFT_115517 [Baudoinia panamericana UAMH 10762]|uniref:CENP-V/GFA domain-containing protein n=1 Tax=Baudoinia panamericana (strain UAMH 10762) TaxID=717646 RepID=M2M769_BAUPA|nr:uncharacterized protein BAUCODRAFT_115517 [Baudoinia panamericana UAMH 10762]EMC92151.1 hypothetical protein BAUCODRAFT_115517 [Baudoinia panamericana UAMH 10762]